MALPEAPTAIAVAALVEEGRVLLVHRRPGRAHYPDCWDLPGGHVEDGESALQAVRRECREELGIEAHSPRPFPMGCSDPALARSAFLVTTWDGTPANLAPDEHDDLGWFDVDELASLTLADPAARQDLVTAVRRAGWSSGGWLEGGGGCAPQPAPADRYRSRTQRWVTRHGRAPRGGR